MTDIPEFPLPLDVRAIMEIIPHRFPFLLVDRVVEMDIATLHLVALKNVTMNEPFFAGHYPEMPVMPGVLQVEAMAQAAAIFIMSLPENKDKVPFFASIDNVKFRRPVVPGDQLRIEVQVLRHKARIAKAQAHCKVDGEVASEALLTCMLGDK